MIAVGLTGDTSVNPKVVADYSVRNGYRVNGVGTAWGLMTTAAKDFGLRSQELSKNKAQIAEFLRSGRPIIASMAQVISSMTSALLSILCDKISSASSFFQKTFLLVQDLFAGK